MHTTRHQVLRSAGLAGALVLVAGLVGTSGATAEIRTATGPDASDPWPITACGTYSGTGCAPTSSRVDLVKPTFSHPTRITNPLFPIGGLRSVVQLGHVDGAPFRSEQTLLPRTSVVHWDGQDIEVLLSQYLAYADGRLEELAVDRYAQADDGSVWYFGEDVFDYVDGSVAVTEGTWLAGRDGPPAMIMPAHPKVGDVFRTENIIGVVFEEVRVTAVDRTVAGPLGPVGGAMVGEELHLDGTRSAKVFAPGYGEFFTRDGRDVEALALAVPTDAAGTPLPPRLRSLSTGTWGVLENLRLRDWEAADATVVRLNRQWRHLRTQPQPRRVAGRLDRRLADLTAAVERRRPSRGAQAAVDAAQSLLDLQLRYRPAGQVDLDRLHQHAQQLRVLAAAHDRPGVWGEVATMEWIRRRLDLPEPSAAELDPLLAAMRAASDGRNLSAAADHAARVGALARTLTARNP